MSKLINGKDNTERVVSIEVDDDTYTLFKEDKHGITCDVRPFNRWILHKNVVDGAGQLSGNQTYRYFTKHESKEDYEKTKKKSRWGTYYTTRCDKQNVMLKDGVTYFKGMKVDEVSVLSFDIETSGISHNSASRVYLISNTFRRNGKVERKLFSVDQYNDDKEMIYEWANWVRTVNPSVITGHNILGFDLPYLQYRSGSGLYLGRNMSKATFDKKPRQFRKDGSQTYDYHNCKIFGREIVDTFMLSIKYDIGRKYESYGLKQIMKQEGLEKDGRLVWDFSKHTGEQAYADKDLWEKFKTYAEDDADDALALLDLMLPSFFYYNQVVPMGLQELILTASGSQVNSIMVRSYLQDGGSIPQASDRAEYEGAISRGNPGLFKHVNKMDVASLYPSIMICDTIYDTIKDPKGNFQVIIRQLTKERLENKQKAKDTKDRYYSDLEQAQKIIINSAYGFMGAAGLNYNYPAGASAVTKRGREILTSGIKWVEDNGYNLVNVDTDSFSYSTGSRLTKDVFDSHIAEVNNISPEGIVWEDDGQYKTVVVVKAKNYVLEDYKSKVKIKGSSLKATMKEPALKIFINSVINLLLKGRKDGIIGLYNDYAAQIYNLRDITPWCSKKTVTKSVLYPSRTQESRILAAIGNRRVSEGDKIFVFFEEKEKVSLRENFQGLYCSDTLYGKLYNTMKIFETVIDIDMIPNYKLKCNEHIITTLGEKDAVYINDGIDPYADFREWKKVESPYSDAEDKVTKMRIIASENNKHLDGGDTAS